MQKYRSAWYETEPEKPIKKPTRAKGIVIFAVMALVILSVVFFIIPAYSKYFSLPDDRGNEENQNNDTENHADLPAADSVDNTNIHPSDSAADTGGGNVNYVMRENDTETVKPDSAAIEEAAPLVSTDTISGEAESGTESVGDAEEYAYTFGEAVPENAVIADEEYFLGSVFIGDSRTVGFSMHSGIRARFWGHTGLNVSIAPTESFVPMTDGTKATVSEALEATADIKNIYISLGINELGWYSNKLFAQRYGEFVAMIKEAAPDADIYIQSVLPISKSAAENEYASSGGNEKIRTYNELIKTMCAELSVYYVDTYSLFADEDGNLPADAGFDGVHLNPSRYREWGEYVSSHTIVK